MILAPRLREGQWFVNGLHPEFPAFWAIVPKTLTLKRRDDSALLQRLEKQMVMKLPFHRAGLQPLDGEYGTLCGTGVLRGYVEMLGGKLDIQ